MSTVRNELAAIRPHVSAKVAWRETIRLLRKAKKDGQRLTLTSQSAVHRLLDLNSHPEMDLPSLKEFLRQVVQEPSNLGKESAAIEIDRWAAKWLPKHAINPVTLSARGWPDWLSTDDKEFIWGPASDQFVCSPAEAAQLFHHLDGLNLGGSLIRLSHNLATDQVLPPVIRKNRARKRVRGHSCWLPHVDEEGRISATPRPIAEMHGEMLNGAADVVVDAFCGLGADTVSAALAGCTVFAIEKNPNRLELAKANVDHFGVANKVTFLLGDATQIGPRLLNEHPDAAVFLDPPWGGVQWDRAAMNFDTLFGRYKPLWNAGIEKHPILLKLPRTFDTASIPPTKTIWKFRIG
ncbi:MAG: RsmD family RNA methyltransferase, partial [Myxococcota bacterium]